MSELIPIPQAGAEYLHRNGNTYTVLLVTSEPDDGERAEKFPRTVVYRAPDGRVWSRSLERFRTSMALTKAAPTFYGKSTPADMLQFLSDRLIHFYGENANLDYHHAARAHALAIRGVPADEVVDAEFIAPGTERDGALFRFWIQMAAEKPATVAKALANCVTAHDYRDSLSRLMLTRPAAKA
ncbi:hypothetical protein [Burkholderia sp. Ac-20349]|uniref:hypothetical protein n=1 Tax=Burkholderia sp. Ac-20349 TaxID=2703893 RepID=UPI00197C7F69|nr:hypothetical protein [Burkholderia sp. Ac-20349]MBN3839300.1 hypothetical protein [Burkholderia sp. Ac-20349]